MNTNTSNRQQAVCLEYGYVKATFERQSKIFLQLLKKNIKKDIKTQLKVS